MHKDKSVKPARSLGRGIPIKDRETTAELSRKLSILLDDAFRFPGTNIRFGWDTIIGLVPGVGDAATALLALIPVATAWKLGASRWMMFRMLANVGIDTTIGAIPIVGDAFDVFYRSNRRNSRMLKHFIESTESKTDSKQDDSKQDVFAGR